MKIHGCRVCSNSVLVPIGSLGDIAISDFTEKPEKGNIYPLELVYCEKCTLLQLAHNFPRRLIYEDQYWYKSELNREIVKDLEEIVTQALSYVDYGTDDTWIDIGANDGTLLSFVPDSTKVGVDPSDVANPHANVVYKAYWEDLFTSDSPAKVITAIACLYDLPDPNKFVANVKNHLHKDGIFVCQLMTLQPMIENNDVGNICHEHLEFYSYKSLVTLFEQNGLEIFRVEENDMNGGSYRIYAQHLQEGFLPGWSSVTLEEKQYTVQDLKDFFRRLERTKGKMKKFLQDADGIIYGYGASTKMNTILQYYKIAPRAIIDVNPDKIGKYTVNTNVPIISTIPEDADYLWVFPYGFLDYFRTKEKNYKGKWMTSIPKFTII